jgi:(2Fe-2S) ferredoxin
MGKTDDSKDPLAAKVEKLGLGEIERHIFLCADPSSAQCCKRKKGLESWGYLKKRLKELGLPVGRTKANCLRVCQQGPIAVVYPDGVWYHSCTPEVLEEIIQSHLLRGEPVEEYVIAKSEGLIHKAA